MDQFWRGRGAVGMLNNLIRYIRWNPQRREAFADCKEGGELSDFDGLNVSFLRLIYLPKHVFPYNSVRSCWGTSITHKLVTQTYQPIEVNDTR